jgi:hypothetical protein
LHGLDRRRIGQTGHADDVEQLDAIDRAAGDEQRLKRRVKSRVVRIDDGSIVAADTHDMGIGAAIIVEVPNRVAEQGT